MFLFSKKSKDSLGIDIGASAVKVVELTKEGGRHRLKNYAVYPLTKYLEKEDYQVGQPGSKISDSEMVEIIKKGIKEAKINSRNVFLSIPVYSSFSTLIDFPNMPEKEISAAIPFEARKYIPVPISEVVLDWSIVNPLNKPTDPSKRSNHQVLLIAVPKEVISSYTKIVRSAGLVLKGIEEETFSLTRALIANDKSTFVLIDAGARSINVSIIDDGYIRAVHNLELGGAKITRAIAQQSGFGLEKAEKLKKELSTGGSANHQELKLKGSVQSALGHIVLEIKKIIDNYQGKYTRKVEKAILIGGGVQLFGFVDYVSTKLTLDATVGDPFARLGYPTKLERVLKELGPSLAVAVGLAMRE